MRSTHRRRWIAHFAWILVALAMPALAFGTPGNQLIQQPKKALPQADCASKTPGKCGAQVDPKAFARGIDQLIESAQKALATPSATPLTAKELAKRVGPTPATLYAWVQDNTYLVSYQGVLRGAHGVLMDGQGNSLDRSLLLAHALKEAGHTVRLKRAKLDGASAKEKLGPLFKKTPAAVDSDAVKAATESALAKLDAKSREAIVKQQASAQKLVEKMKTMATTQAEALSASVALSTDEEDWVSALQDHWWVELKEQASWSALDVTTSAPGETLGTAGSVVALDRIPAALYHRVKIAVVAEVANTGRLGTKTILEHTLRVADLKSHTISFSNIPMHWPDKLDLFKDPKKAQAGLMAAAQKESEWWPILTLPGKTVRGKSIKADGQVNHSPAVQKSTKGKMGKVFGSLDVLGGALGGRKKPTGTLTAQWLSFESTGPGLKTQPQTRMIWDGIGPAARETKTHQKKGWSKDAQTTRGLAMMTHVNLLAMGASPSAESTTRMALNGVVSNQKALRGLAAAANGKKDADVGKLAQQMKPFPAELYTLATSRLRLSEGARRLYQGQANILSTREGLGLSASGQLLSRRGFDIVMNTVNVRPGAAAKNARLHQGVFDTVAEAGFLLRKKGEGPVANTALLYGNALKKNSGWVTLHKPADVEAQAAGLSADRKAQLRAELKAGYTVVMPTVAGTHSRDFGWWRVDARSGSALGMGDGGLGNAAIEAQVIRAMQFTAAAFTFATSAKCVATEIRGSMLKMNLCIACSFASAFAILAVIQSAGLAMVFWNMTGAGCRFAATFL